MKLRHSWKAITCCVSKGMLAVITIVAIVSAVAFAVKIQGERKTARRASLEAPCLELHDKIVDARVTRHERHLDERGWWVVTTETQDTQESNALIDEWKATGCAEFWGDFDAIEPKAEPPEWLAAAFVGFLVFGIFASIMVSVCQNQILYCQAAVDTGRKPWYWLPRIGNPLPGRQSKTVTCDSCGHEKTRVETEDEYRERLGLPPLEQR